MCQYCERERATLRSLTKEERQDLVCVWPADEDTIDRTEETICGQSATHLLSGWLVESHLCGEHVEEQKAELEDSADQLHELEHYSGDPEFIPIEKAGTCEYCDLVTGEACSRPASQAKCVREDFSLCDEHVAEWMRRRPSADLEKS